VFGVLKTEIHTNEFEEVISKPTENNTLPLKTKLFNAFEGNNF
jgi:hypothetical protein